MGVNDLLYNTLEGGISYTIHSGMRNLIYNTWKLETLYTKTYKRRITI